MIFVTVGTHEQPFDRLLKYIDKLRGDETITEDIIVQTGYSTYEPKHCEWQKLYSYHKMLELVKQARIVITHGGPSSFMMSLQIGKIPLVVPRQKKYGEHVNNHQLVFSKVVAERYKNIIVVEEIDGLGNLIINYDNVVADFSTGLKSNNTKFCEKFKLLVNELFCS